MPRAPAGQGAKRKAARVMVAARASVHAAGGDRSAKTITDFVDVEDLDWSDQEQEAALEVVVDDAVALEVVVEGDIDGPGGHVHTTQGLDEALN